MHDNIIKSDNGQMFQIRSEQIRPFEYRGQHEHPLELNDLIVRTEGQQWDEELLGLIPHPFLHGGCTKYRM